MNVFNNLKYLTALSNLIDTFLAVLIDKAVMNASINDVAKDMIPETIRITLETIHSTCFPSVVVVTRLESLLFYFNICIPPIIY